MVSRNFLFAIFISLLIALEIFFYWPRFAELDIKSDALEYHQLAVNLLNGKGFYLEERGGRTMIREPGYPFFIFLNYKIFGVNPDIIRVEQVILLLLICLFVYKLCKKILAEGDFIAKIAVLAIAACPLFIIYSGEIISETLAAFLLIASCYFLIKSFNSEKLIYIFLAGFCLSLLILVKSIFIFMPLIIALVCLFIPLQKKILKIAIFLGICALLISPWFYRNYMDFGKIAIADRGGQSAYVHTSKSELNSGDLQRYVISSLLSQYFVRLRDNNFDIFSINIKPVNDKLEYFNRLGYDTSETDNLLFQESKNLWLRQPVKNFLIGFLEFAKANAPTVPRNSIIFVYNTNGSPFTRFLKGTAIILIRIFWLALLSISFYGIFKIVKLKRYPLFILVVFIFYLNSIIFFLEGVPRFIFPIYSLYFIFFALGLNDLLARLKFRIS